MAAKHKSQTEELRAGDAARVTCKIGEGRGERVETFGCKIVKIEGSGAEAKFTVRRLERLFGGEMVLTRSQIVKADRWPALRSGDQVKMYLKVREGDSERIQVFEGTVIRMRGAGDSQSVTVRKTSFGVGVERTFPLYTPHVDRIEVVRSTKVRRARLYYLRGLTGKAARLTESEARPEKSDGTGPAGPAPAISAAPAPQPAAT